MSDVAAVLLSHGEPFRERARATVAAQTLPIREVIDIDGVSPFSRALNTGAARVTKRFFVQVDADMILDPACVEMLRGAVRDDTGIVVGELRDALVGRVVGVKLFRTECFRRATLRDSISPDTDFGAALARAGWRTVYVGRPAPGREEPIRTLGEHRPDYTPVYTFRKHLLEGRRYWYRGALHGMRARLLDLEASSHPLAALALLALGHGLFLPTEADELKPAAADPRAEWLHALLESRRSREIPTLERSAGLRAVFRAFFASGQELALSGAGASVHATLQAVAGRDVHAVVAKVALGHGLLSTAGRRTPPAPDERLVRRLVLYGLGRHPDVITTLGAHARHAARRLRGRDGNQRW